MRTKSSADRQTSNRRAGCGLPVTILRILEYFDDVSGQTFVDLPVAWHGLDNAGPRIAIPIVLTAVPNERATKPFDGPEEVGSLHDTTSSSTLRIPGICPLVTS